jgi:hypothetical protein
MVGRDFKKNRSGRRGTGGGRGAGAGLPSGSPERSFSGSGEVGKAHHASLGPLQMLPGFGLLMASAGGEPLPVGVSAAVGWGLHRQLMRISLNAASLPERVHRSVHPEQKNRKKVPQEDRGFLREAGGCDALEAHFDPPSVPLPSNTSAKANSIGVIVPSSRVATELGGGET